MTVEPYCRYCADGDCLICQLGEPVSPWAKSGLGGSDRGYARLSEPGDRRRGIFGRRFAAEDTHDRERPDPEPKSWPGSPGSSPGPVPSKPESDRAQSARPA